VASKAASFKIGKQGSGNKKSASGDTGEIPTVKTYARGLKVGKTYYVISHGGDYKKKVTVTDFGEMKKGEDLIFSDYWCVDMTGTTSDGGTLHCCDSSVDRIYTYAGKDCYKQFSEQNTNDGHIVKILADDVTYVWTLDGTEPKLGQEDYYGTSDKYAQYHNKPVKMQLRGSFHKNRMSGVYEKEVLSDPYCWWVKVYKGKKIIFDSRVEKYDKFSKSK
jgi:hypothetical protein